MKKKAHSKFEEEKNHYNSSKGNIQESQNLIEENYNISVEVKEFNLEADMKNITTITTIGCETNFGAGVNFSTEHSVFCHDYFLWAIF